MIEHDHPKISIQRQCEWLDLSRSSLYYPPVRESPENLPLMRTEYTFVGPILGVRRMTQQLRRLGQDVNYNVCFG